MHSDDVVTPCRKRHRTETPAKDDALAATETAGGYFEMLPDDLVVSILCKLSSSADYPSDLISASLTCKRFNGLGFHRCVLAAASSRCLSIRPSMWSETTHNFLKRCVEAGNLEASFILGMIRFYCLEMRRSGTSLLARASLGLHPLALYSLGVIHFNGSGGAKSSKDLRNAVALCARAASLGYIDAIREIGHCLQDGYGIHRDVGKGRRFLIEASVREILGVLPSSNTIAMSLNSWLQGRYNSKMDKEAAALAVLPQASTWNVRPRDPHPANRFLVEWFVQRGFAGKADGMRLCSYDQCGRPETRLHEFRRCSVCSTVTYCSRACQALDWKLKHRSNCVAADNWILGFGGDVAEHEGGVAANVQVALLNEITEDAPMDAAAVAGNEMELD